MEKEQTLKHSCFLEIENRNKYGLILYIFIVAIYDIGQGDREEFDLGPIYGHQWRHFGYLVFSFILFFYSTVKNIMTVRAPYVDCHTDYKGKGVDQLANVPSSFFSPTPLSLMFFLIVVDPS